MTRIKHYFSVFLIIKLNIFYLTDLYQKFWRVKVLFPLGYRLADKILYNYTMIGFLSNIKKIFLDALFAPICANCRKIIPSSEKFLCGPCLSSIRTNKTLFCPVCRARVPESRKICHFNSPYLLAAASNYDDPAAQSAIRFLKYNRIKGLGMVLADIMLNYLSELNLDLNEFCVIPVPLHRRKEFFRGFNQAQVMAEHISQKLNLPLENFLKRTKNNKQQAGIKNPQKRKENIQNCFSAISPKNISGKNIIVIDDVFTSGSTMNEAVRVLKFCGARKIIALVAAKA